MEYVTEIRGILKAQKGTNVVKCRSFFKKSGFDRNLVNFFFVWLNRSFAESSLIKLWKALFAHLVNIVQNNVMRAEQVGNMFGSLLIAKSSKHWKEVGKYCEQF